MHTSETDFHFSCPSNSVSAQFHLFRAKQKASADGTDMHGLQSPRSLTDLWVEGGRRCARAADKLHKEGPVLKSEEEEAAAAAANARERRDECGPVVNHQGKDRGMKEKNKNKNKEGRRETRVCEGNGGETKREEEREKERSTQKDHIQMQSISRNSHLPGQNVPSVWSKHRDRRCVQAPSGLIRAWLGCRTLPHSSELSSDLCQGRGKGHELLGGDGGGKPSGVASWPPAWLGDQQPSWRDTEVSGF